jgi:mannose-6-phosphate isomerase
MFELTGVVKPYAWGSPTVLPNLLGHQPTGEPQAELWLGAHPGGSSTVRLERGEVAIRDALAAEPEALLGVASVAAFGPRLPFLLKVLAVEAPLSLQAHPTREQAAEGFAAEEAAGVPIDAANRLYKDREHKPELICAVTPFEALVGFRPVAQTVALLDALAVTALGGVRDRLAARGEAALRPVVADLLATATDARSGLVEAVREAAVRLAAEPAGAAYALELDVAQRLAKAYPADPGVIIALLLNATRLQPGEALFLPAGMLHAYLSGVVVEPQASSDNTLRGGLSEKHVDPAELLRVLDASERPPHRVDPVEVAPGVSAYVPPVPEFRLARLDRAGAAVDLDGTGPAVLLVHDGELTVRSGGEEARVGRGRSVFVPAGRGPLTVSGDGGAYWASTNLS